MLASDAREAELCATLDKSVNIERKKAFFYTEFFSVVLRRKYSILGISVQDRQL